MGSRCVRVTEGTLARARLLAGRLADATSRGFLAVHPARWGPNCREPALCRLSPNWVGFGGLESTKAVLDIPASLDVLAILPFGYPARAVGQGKKQRKPLRDVAHLERYGRPFA
jgi:hypothetical protein